MERFKKMDTVISPDGNEQITVHEFARRHFGGAAIRIYRNSRYQVIKREVGATNDRPHQYAWLSIKRLDREPIHDWRDLQEIKNELVGPECEGIELYPAESRRVDSANQYHLFVILDPKIRLPFGFKERLVEGTDAAAKQGAKQRSFEVPPEAI